MDTIDFIIFQKLQPWRVESFVIKNRFHVPSIFLTSHVTVWVIDTPINPPPGGNPLVGFLLVPIHLESDWNFSTQQGRKRLMSRYHNVSRLVIIAQKVDKYDEATTYSRTKINKQDEVKVRRHLIGLLNKLLPKACTGWVVDCNFLRYEEELVFSEQIVAYHMVGSNDKYQVLNVQVDIPGDTNINFRRRLRYKSLPNVIQAECIIVARDHVEKLIKNVNLRDLSGIAGVTHVVDTSKLVNPSLQMMVSGLSLVEKLKDGEKVNSLCLGVKGGVLMKFLIDVLGFKVVVVEKEQSVIDAAKYYFKLEEHEDLDVIQYDEEKFMERIVGGIGALAYIFLFSQRVETNL